MSPAEIAAYIGAAAWIPPIVLLIIKVATKPKLDLRIAHSISLSYNTFGTVIGINLALASERRDALITRATLHLRHERGEERILEWDALQETFLGIRGLPELLSFENTLPALALKVPISSVTHRIIWFTDFGFKLKAQETLARLRDHAEFLRARTENTEDALTKSKEFAGVRDIFVENFFWREGKYKCRLDLDGNHRVTRSKSFRFQIGKTDASRLRINLESLDAFLLKATIDKESAITWPRCIVPVLPV
jgi:hypothetical protein